MSPNPRLKSAVGVLALLVALAAARQQAPPQLKIGDRLMDGVNAIKAGDLKSGADLFECSDSGCVAVRAGSFTFASEGGEKSNQILTPAVRVTAEIAGRVKELAARLEFDHDLGAKLQAPAGAKIVVEPINFAEMPKPESPALAAGSPTAVKLFGPYTVQLEPVQIKLISAPAATDLVRGQRSTVSWNVEGASLLPDGATVTISAEPESGKSPAAFRKAGRWQDRLTDQPLSGNAETMFLSSGARRLCFELKIGDQTIDNGDSLRFAITQPKLRLELKNTGRRVGDRVAVAAFSDDKLLNPASLAVEPGLGNDGKVALADATRSIEARYQLFGDDERDTNAKFTATEIEIAPVHVDRPLPRIQTVAFKDGVSTTIEPLRPTVLPVVLRAGEREIDADASDLRSLEVVQDPPGALSPIKVVTTGSTSLGLSFVGQKPGATTSLTVKYQGQEIATLIVQVGAAVKSGRLSGKFLPLTDEDVTRIYGSEVAKEYHVVECTLTNTVGDEAGEGKSDVIVQPEGIEFGAVVQSRPKKGGWRIASAAATSGAILPGGTLGLAGFNVGGILDAESLRGFFNGAGKANSPAVVKLLAKHLPKELPDDAEHWANVLNVGVTDMAGSLDWTAFAAAYGYNDSGLQNPEKERLIRRRLQIDTNEAVIGSEFSYVRWRPLSVEAANDVFQVLSRKKGEGKNLKVAQLFLSAGRFLGSVGLMGDDGSGVVSVATRLLPTIKQTLPELSEARRRTLASMLFAGPLRLSPQVPTKKHIFISKEVMKVMFNAEETRISEIVQGSLTADVAIVTSSERTTIGSTGG